MMFGHSMRAPQEHKKQECPHNWPRCCYLPIWRFRNQPACTAPLCQWVHSLVWCPCALYYFCTPHCSPAKFLRISLLPLLHVVFCSCFWWFGSWLRRIPSNYSSNIPWLCIGCIPSSRLQHYVLSRMFLTSLLCFCDSTFACILFRLKSDTAAANPKFWLFLLHSFYPLLSILSHFAHFNFSHLIHSTFLFHYKVYSNLYRQFFILSFSFIFPFFMIQHYLLSLPIFPM